MEFHFTAPPPPFFFEPQNRTRNGENCRGADGRTGRGPSPVGRWLRSGPTTTKSPFSGWKAVILCSWQLLSVVPISCTPVCSGIPATVLMPAPFWRPAWQRRAAGRELSLSAVLPASAPGGARCLGRWDRGWEGTAGVFKGASTTSPPTPCTALFQRFLNEGGTGLLSGIDLSATGSTPGPFALSFPYPFHKSFTEAPLPHWVHALFEIPGEGSHSRLHQRQRRQRDPDSKEKRRRFSQSSLLAGAPAFSIMECFEMMYLCYYGNHAERMALTAWPASPLFSRPAFPGKTPLRRRSQWPSPASHL